MFSPWPIFFECREKHMLQIRRVSSYTINLASERQTSKGSEIAFEWRAKCHAHFEDFFPRAVTPGRINFSCNLSSFSIPRIVVMLQNWGTPVY